MADVLLEEATHWFASSAPPVGATFGATAPLLEQEALVEQSPPGGRELE